LITPQVELSLYLMASDAPGEEGHGLGLVAGLNTVIPALLSAASGYGIALLLWKPYSILWYTHEAHGPFEEALVVGDLTSGAFLTAVLNVVIVSGIVLWQWDRGDIRATDSDLLELSEPRTRVWHVIVTAFSLGTILSLFVLLNALVGFGAASVEEIHGSTFAFWRTLSGALVGGAAGLYISVSLVVNLSKGKLQEPDHGGNMVSRLSLWSSENPKKVVGTFLLVTLLLGAGIPQIDTDVDAADVLPRGSKHTKAAQNLSDDFKSSFTQQVTFQFEVNPEQCREDSRKNIPLRSEEDMHCDTITDEVYIRAIEEFFHFLRRYSYQEEAGLFADTEDPNITKDGDGPFADKYRTVDSPFRYQIGLPSFFKLINWTRSGGQDDAPASAYSLPPPDNRSQWQAVNQTTFAAIESSINPVLDPNRQQAAMLYLVPAQSDYTAREIGEFAIEARQAYEEWDGAEYKVYQENEPDHPNPRFTVDLPVANAHGSELVEEDLQLLMPLVAYLIIVALYAAFRDLRSVFVAGSALTLAVLWTYGAMGLMDIALNPLNLLIVPLIMGSGIDYAIHMINEFQEHKSEGLSDAEAFLVAGKRAGVAMFLATFITVAGLLVMVASPSLLMAQLGGLSAIAITSVFLLTVSFIPAVLTLMEGTDEMGANFKPSTSIPKFGRFVNNHRIAFSVLLIVATVGAAVGMTNLQKEEFGEPALNWPEDDPMRQEHVRGLAGFYNSEPGEPTFKTNVVVVQGDNTEYDTHQYIDALNSNLTREAEDTEIVNMDTARHLPFIVRTWLKVRDGPESVPRGIISEELGNQGFEENNEYPKTRPEIQRTMDNIFRSPLSEFASLFVNPPNYNITIITVAVKTGSFDRASQAWDSLTRATEEAEPARPDDVHTAFVGNTATNYLFVEEELPWINYMSYIAFAVATLAVLAATRDFRATLAVAGIVGLTSIWLLGVLPLFDIGLAITLMLPLVFVFNIGSDYAIHMIWNIRQVGDVDQVFSSVGKAIFFSALTDIGAFLLFTSWIPGLSGIRNLPAQEAIEATVLAIAIIFFGTVIIAALFYDVVPADEGEGEEEAAPTAPSGGSAPADTDLPAVEVRTEGN
jgi:predicted RND superfamily exporter protein